MFSKEQLSRYARHFVLPEIGVQGQKKLLASRVLVVGAGALGSAALYYLAAAGVGTLGIADGDCVELSNLQRQVLHRTSNIGMNKTASAEIALREQNPDVTITLHPFFLNADNIKPVIEEYDFIVDGTDKFETKYLLNDSCVLSGNLLSTQEQFALEVRCLPVFRAKRLVFAAFYRKYLIMVLLVQQREYWEQPLE